jgi:hypothetical protein
LTPRDEDVIQYKALAWHSIMRSRVEMSGTCYTVERTGFNSLNANPGY